MSSDTVFSAIQTFVTANWTASPVQWENDSYVPPAANADGSVSPWIMIEVYGDLYGQLSIGAGSPADNFWREEGFVVAYAWVQVGTGSTAARQLLRLMAQLFKGTRLLNGLLYFTDMNIGGAAAGTSDGLYWGMPLRISYVYDSAPS